MKAGALILALATGVSPVARAQDFAQDFWWLRVVQALTTPLGVATPAILEQVVPGSDTLGLAPQPIADPAALPLDAQLPAVPRAVRALAPYVTAAHAVDPAELAVPTSPWFLQTALAIKALRWRGVIQSRSDCEAVLQIVLDTALSRPDVDYSPVHEVFAQALRAVSCAPGERLYARAQELMRPPGPEETSPPTESRRLGTGDTVGPPYNAFPQSPLPVTRCSLGDTLPPAWVFSNGSAIALAGGASTQIGRLLADYSRHFPAILVVSGIADSVYGVTFTGMLYRRAGVAGLAPVGQCD